MSWTCPHCGHQDDIIGYEEHLGVDIDSDGTIELDSVGDGEVWKNRYFCSNCEHTLTVGEDIFID